MKRVNNSSREFIIVSHSKGVSVIPVQEDNDSSSEPISTSSFPPNRRGVEAKKAQPISKDQVTSEVITDVVDLGSESLTSGSAASQTGIANFQETRFISNAELRKRALEAFRQAEQRRDELLHQETRLESSSLEE